MISRKPPDFPFVVEDVLGKLEGEDQGVGFLKSLFDQDFEDFKNQLDPYKPLVVIITTHGSLNNRQNDTFFTPLKT